MRQTGKIISWKTDKGFGFIAPLAGGKEIFVHIKAFGRDNSAPKIGTLVSYEEVLDAQGRVRAERAMINAGHTPGPAAKALALASAFLLLLTGMTVYGAIPLLLLYCYLGMTVLTFTAYAVDKSAAQNVDLR